ncbi:MAG: hypothetical protein ACOC5I_03120, partial [Gemmatimonadota bacterium]
MAIARRVLRLIVLAVVVLVLAVTGVLLFLTRAAPGVEGTGRFVLDRLQGSINGELVVGGIQSASLLEGVMLRDVTLSDEAGRPFLQADSIRLGYRLGRLLVGSVVFDRADLYGPDVTVERLPGQARWNFEQILSDTTSSGEASPDDGGRLILIEDVTIHDGRVAVRIPWDDGDPEDGRALVESVPGGTVRTLRFHDVGARLPRIVWESPDREGRSIE